MNTPEDNARYNAMRRQDRLQEALASVALLFIATMMALLAYRVIAGGVPFIWIVPGTLAVVCATNAIACAVRASRI